VIVLRPRRPLRRAAGLVCVLAFAGALPVLAQESGSNPTGAAGSAPADTIADRWPQDVRSRTAPRAEPVPAARQVSQERTQTAAQRKARTKSARAARHHKANARTQRAAAHRRARATIKAQHAKPATTARAKSATRVRVGKRRAGRPLALTPPVLRQAQRRS